MNRDLQSIMDEFGILGYVLQRNGPRLYIERVRGRMKLIDSTRTSQRAYIDLTTYTAHCITESDLKPTAWCCEQSRSVEKALAPLARYLRMVGVKIDGCTPAFSQQRWVFRLLHEGGVRCHIERDRIVLNVEGLGKPDARVELRCTANPARWMRLFSTHQQVVDDCQGNPMFLVELAVYHKDANTLDLVRRVAEQHIFPAVGQAPACVTIQA